MLLMELVRGVKRPFETEAGRVGARRRGEGEEDPY